MSNKYQLPTPYSFRDITPISFYRSWSLRHGPSSKVGMGCVYGHVPWASGSLGGTGINLNLKRSYIYNIQNFVLWTVTPQTPYIYGPLFTHPTSTYQLPSVHFSVLYTSLLSFHFYLFLNKFVVIIVFFTSSHTPVKAYKSLEIYSSNFNSPC